MKHVVLNGINDGKDEEDDRNDDVVMSIDTSELEAEEPFRNTNETGLRVVDPLLLSLGDNYVDLSDDKLYVLIGELVKIQFERKNTKTPSSPDVTMNRQVEISQDASNPSCDTPVTRLTPVTSEKISQNKKSCTTFAYSHGETTYSAVPIPCHKNNNAFVRYHCSTPYIDEMVNAIGKSPSSKEGNSSAGAKRILQHLSIIAPNEYAQVAKELGFNVGGKLDAISLAAMKHDATLKDWQMLKILKHLKHTLGAIDIAVPFRAIKQFSKGYITPRVNKFKHQYKDGTFAWIECTYASISEVYVELVKEIMIENEIKPIDVVALDVVLGGDHGLKAFCLGFRAIVTMANGKIYHLEYGGAALITGKDITFFSLLQQENPTESDQATQPSRVTSRHDQRPR